jgi:NAD(P)-dependent dehydrogenase (short-subunit alcohol dehydrogenase family)
MMRLAGKIAVIVGAGQSPGEGIGNGRATVLRFAQEGAKVLAVDRDLASAEETAVLAAKSVANASPSKPTSRARRRSPPRWRRQSSAGAA